jgi:PAS domain S-box-containing protein
LGIAGLALITVVCFQLEFGVARTGFAYVILLTLLSPLGSFSASAVLSIIAAACLNFFFAPPLFEFRIDLADDIERIVVFLTTSLIVTGLTSKLKRSENELRRHQSKLENAQRIAHFGWWERDFATQHVALSDEACQILGVQPVDLPDWHGRWLDLIHPADRARAAEAAAAALVRGGPRYDLEYRVVRPDGTQRVIHSQGDVTWDSSGRPMRQFGVMQDITELRQAEEQLRASEERFRTLVQFSFDVYWETDALHRFTRQEFANTLLMRRQSAQRSARLDGKFPTSSPMTKPGVGTARHSMRICRSAISNWRDRHPTAGSAMCPYLGYRYSTLKGNSWDTVASGVTLPSARERKRRFGAARRTWPKHKG